MRRGNRNIRSIAFFIVGKHPAGMPARRRRSQGKQRRATESRPNWQTGMSALLLREVRVGLYLVDLFSMAFAVRGDEQDPLIAVERFADRRVHRMLAQIFRPLQELDR